MARQKDKEAMVEFEILAKLRDALEADQPARTVQFIG